MHNRHYPVNVEYLHKSLKISALSLIMLVVALCSSTQRGLSQENNLGIPRVYNYSKEDYKGGTQNWDAHYLNSGKVLFANNDGLLVFNGSGWNVYQTPQKTPVRSLEVSHNNTRFWVGGQDEIGYFYRENGKFEYQDQKHLIPEEHSSLEDVWDIVSGKDDDIYFRSRNKIFRIHDDGCEVFSPGSYSTFLQNVNGAIYSYVGYLGLIRLDGISHEIVEGGEVLTEKSVIKMISIDSKTALIITLNNGIYTLKDGQISQFKTNIESYLDQFSILSSHYIEKEQRLLIGTEAGGLIVLDVSNGKAQFVINKKHGLQNNTVSSITSDKSGNVWLGTHNGIDKVDLASASTLTYPDGELEGAVYDIKEWRDALYFATSHGVYKVGKKGYYNPTIKNIYTKVEDTDGQAWGLNVIDDRLYLGHTLGAYEIKSDGSAIQFGTSGAWKFIKMDEQSMIVGTYFGLELYKKNEDKWIYSRNLEGFTESSRIMIKDINDNVWVSHPYKGLFRMRFTDDFKTMTVDTINGDYGLPDLSDCYVHEIEGVPLVSINDGLYMFNYKTEKFEASEEMNSFFKDQSFKRIFDTDRGLWYITDMETGLFIKNISGLNTSLEKKTYIKGKVPFVGGFEYLYPLSEKEVLIATDKGVQHNIFQLESAREPLVQINTVQIASHKKDSVIYEGFNGLPDGIEIDYEYHDVRIDFVSDWMETKDLNMQYTYMLEGYDKHWSEWSSLQYKEYTNLPAGSYAFHVKCSTYENTQSEESSFSFEINHPWYSSVVMKIVYAAIGLFGLYMLILLPNRRIKKEKEIIEIQKIETEAIVENLENESLQKEIKYQNQELANLTMHLLQKSETLKQIRTEVENVRKKIKDPAAKKEIRKVVSLINSDNRLEEDWINFSYQFDKVHHNFIKRIREEYPKLTANDLKLCAYLRLNLSTKEIAPLLNISTRGVEISRYRLRKKLALTSDINLNSFMIDY